MAPTSEKMCPEYGIKKRHVPYSHHAYRIIRSKPISVDDLLESNSEVAGADSGDVWRDETCVRS
jgi:hypothetical protein